MRNVNQLYPKLVGCATNLLPFMANDSASRLVMVGNHLSQMLVVEGATTRRVKSGMEREYAKYTFDIKMPATGRVVRIIRRFGSNAVAGPSRPPEIIILYEDLEQKVDGRAVLGCVSIHGYHSKHQSYGFEYAIPEMVKRIIVKDEIIPKGTILAKSPGIAPNGDYMFGIESNVAYMTIPQIIEDGFVISDEYAQRLATTSIGNRMVSWGKNKIPLNLYGDATTYRPFPEIGQAIRPDGLIFATRELEPMLGIIDLAPEKLREPSVVFDDCYYAPPGAIVTDIRILQDATLVYKSTPVGMDEQLKRYAAGQSAYYDTIVQAWNTFQKEHKRFGTVFCTDELHRLIVQECYPDNPNTVDYAVNRNYRATPFDECMLDIKFVRRVVPTVGFKITDLSGGKGVVCAVWPKENMPVDAWGNRADVIMDGHSTFKRMNFSRLYTHWCGATCRYMDDLIKGNLTDERIAHDTQYLLPQHRQQYIDNALAARTIDGLIGLLKDFYCTVSPLMGELTLNLLTTKEAWLNHIEYIKKDRMEVIIPSHSPNAGGEMIYALANRFPIPISPVVYTGASGIQCTTIDPVLIGSKYIILLEKTGEDWAAVASAKRQHYGVPARLTNRDKYSSPWRRQPVRILGEAEIRLLCAVMSPKLVSQLLELPNSPNAQRIIARRLITEPKPTNIARIIAPEDMPCGNSRALLFVRHLMECAGCRYTNA